MGPAAAPQPHVLKAWEALKAHGRRNHRIMWAFFVLLLVLPTGLGLAGVLPHWLGNFFMFYALFGVPLICWIFYYFVFYYCVDCGERAVNALQVRWYSLPFCDSHYAVYKLQHGGSPHRAQCPSCHGALISRYESENYQENLKYKLLRCPHCAASLA